MSNLKLWEIIQQGISKSYEGYGLHCLRGDRISITDEYGRIIGCIHDDDHQEAPISILINDGDGGYCFEVNEIHDWMTAEIILCDLIELHKEHLAAGPPEKTETETEQLLRELRQCRTRLGKLIEEMTK